MKKDEDRFTIRFNTIDPRQKLTRDILAAIGRRKASFITDAVCDYLVRHGGDGAIEFSSPVTAMPSLLPIPHAHTPGNNKASHNQAQELPKKVDATTEMEAIEPLKDIPFDNDMREAVLDALGMFNM